MQEEEEKFWTLIGAFIIAVIQNGMNHRCAELYPKGCAWPCSTSAVLLDMRRREIEIGSIVSFT